LPKPFGRDKQLKTVLSVAALLDREIDSTTEEWLRRVKLVPDLSRLELRDVHRAHHLPQLFRDLISRLRLADDAPPPSRSSAAAAHGRMRFAQGYSVPMLVEESRLFQVTVFGTLRLHQGELDKEHLLSDVIAIADEADWQLTETVRSFVASQGAA
jgi:hypothetical protein